MKKYLGQAAAIIVMIALTVWMYSGLDADLAPPQSVSAPADDRVPRVQVVRLLQEETERTLVVNGETRINREVMVRGQVAGEVTAVAVAEGDMVAAGDRLISIDPGDIPDRLQASRALEVQRQAELEATRRLVDRGLQNVSEQRAAEARYQDTVANRRGLELQLERTEIRAPLSGVVESLMVEPGSYLSTGAEVAHLLDYDPLKVRVQVSENQINQLSRGDQAEIRLITGERFAGEISNIGTRARPETRTFSVDIRATESAPAAAGITAEVTFPLAPASAHFVSPALLGLNEDGELSLKHLDVQDRVVETPVRLVRTSTQGVWVTGLPETTRLITVGQGFVRAGQQVDPVEVE